MGIPAARIAELRRLTDAPVMECRALLEETGGDLDAAVRLFRERRGIVVSWLMDMGGHGPDHFMEIAFDGDPRGLVRGVDTGSYVRTAMSMAPFSAVRGDATAKEMDLYADPYHNEALLANLRGEASRNIWIYQTMMVAPGLIWIEHGYGSVLPDQLAVEMRVIAAAANADPPRITSWSIEYGGQGYDAGVIQAGADAASLRSYLHMRE